MLCNVSIKHSIKIIPFRWLNMAIRDSICQEVVVYKSGSGPKYCLGENFSTLCHSLVTRNHWKSLALSNFDLILKRKYLSLVLVLCGTDCIGVCWKKIETEDCIDCQ